MNKIMDPVQIGFTEHYNFTASMKSCPKAYASEKVGVLAKIDGQYQIVEYSELKSED